MRRVVVTVALATATLGCGMIGGPSSPDPLDVQNGTTLPVSIVVNAELAVVVPPQSSATIAGADLPTLPWTISARTPTGRELGAMRVAAGDVVRPTGPNREIRMRGAGLRVDLSCGRLDIWVGPPMAGPMPGPGIPGDCEP